MKYPVCENSALVMTERSGIEIDYRKKSFWNELADSTLKCNGVMTRV